jgi:2-polyprenyl-3-methyl-5-hydroxy-6-metoxy-1,4-benzoquinol methylase
VIPALGRTVWSQLTHWWGTITRRYYFEDFVRVYPDGASYSRLGIKRSDSERGLKNFLNHRKFYAFAAQFARGAAAVDIGCGSGYGCQLLKDAGATRVCGADASKAAVQFAKSHYGQIAEFTVQSITDLRMYDRGEFGLTICSEVLEHIKEYGLEAQAIRELKRITKTRGAIVIGTPNSELLGDHGFFFEEMNSLLRKHFDRYSIFENALVPFGDARALWELRVSQGRTGTIVSQAINLDETVLPKGATVELKKGLAPGVHMVGGVEVDTTLLHNTHSWAIVAIRDPD